MKKRRHSVLADLSFQGILILLFTAVVFLAFRHENLAVNGIILCIAILMFIVTYFTSVRTGIIVDIVFIFLLVSYVVLRSVNEGINVSVDTYFWIFWPLAMIMAISGFVSRYQLLDKENEELMRRAERFITIDELTQMNNLLGFQRDAAVYMNISRRYHLELELVLWRLAFEETLEQLLGKEDLKKAISIISDSIKGSLRKEDLVYLVDKEPYIWATLMFSKPEAAEIVISHVRAGVEKAGLGQLISHKNYSLEIEGTVVPYDGSIISPLAYLNMAKDRLWRREAAGMQISGKKKSAADTAKDMEETAQAVTKAAINLEKQGDLNIEWNPAENREKYVEVSLAENGGAYVEAGMKENREEYPESDPAKQWKEFLAAEPEDIWCEVIDLGKEEERKPDMEPQLAEMKETVQVIDLSVEKNDTQGWGKVGNLAALDAEPTAGWKEARQTAAVIEKQVSIKRYGTGVPGNCVGFIKEKGKNLCRKRRDKNVIKKGRHN